jgi:CubicO group peptidase (beta-lactamase class C family)
MKVTDASEVAMKSNTKTRIDVIEIPKRVSGIANRSLFALLVTGALLSVSPPCDAQTGATPPSESIELDIALVVDACVQNAMDDYDIPGLAVAVVMDGEIAYERGYGVKHRQRGGAVDEHTLFRHASVGKMILAAAVLRLVDEGRIDLDDPVTEYVPELQFAPGRWSADQIKVRHLIANTSAVPSFRDLFDDTLSQWAATLTDVPLLARPGAMFNYSNSNFALAGLVVERASGMSLYDYVEAELYRLAGMHDATMYAAQAVASGNYSYGHADDGTVYAPDDYVDRVNGFMSAHDLALWARLMMAGGGDVLSASSCGAAQQPQVSMYHEAGRPTSIGGGSYGFGLFIDQYPSATVIGHSGGIPGWVAHVYWVRSERFALAMLANSWPNAFNGLWDAVECISEAAVGVTMPDTSEPSDLSTWPPYAGTYNAVFEDGFEFQVVVALDDDQLYMTAPKLSDPTETITRALENLHDSTFRYRPDPESWWDVTFLPAGGDTAPARWIRNLRFVGQKAVAPRQVARRRQP